jgi:cellulose biosynthesis protein BcsQ
MSVNFDDSLPAFLGALTKAGIDVSDGAGVVVRDTRGRLSFIQRAELSVEAADKVAAEIGNDLEPYVSPIGPIADQSAPGAKRVFLEQEALSLRIRLGPPDQDVNIKLLDRRAVGPDWLHAPLELVTTPPRLVFASLKGGVGRSTALSVFAAHLADSGHATLVIDLDMEAPGVGSMLIDKDATPLFGSIDYFVESSLRQLDDAFMRDCVAASWLGGGRGRIDVIPSIGSKSLDNPSGVLAKLARAYLESPAENGHQGTFLEQVQELVRRLTALSRYDAVLVDARAGLHETTAAAILGLGADILLFGVDQRQTFIGFKILLSHLKQFPVRNAEDDWRYRLRMVQAKAEPTETALAAYRSSMFDLFDSLFYEHEDAPTSDILETGFRFSLDDSDAPHFSIPIFEDERYRLFDPVRDRTQLVQEMYQKGFGQFIRFCTERLQLNQDETP